MSATLYNHPNYDDTKNYTIETTDWVMWLQWGRKTKALEYAPVFYKTIFKNTCEREKIDLYPLRNCLFDQSLACF
jgi:hypothetical protein